MTPQQNWTSPEGIGTSPQPRLRGLSQEFPDTIYVLYDSMFHRHIVVDAIPIQRHTPESYEDGFQGMACFMEFRAAEDAAAYLGRQGSPGFEPIAMTFDEARLVAQEKLPEGGALMLMDAPERPQVHYIN
ncbi:MAG: hypothetical protein ABIY70_03405 [Capsulimonas sp.]|uniref:hypothetical protein n=1 Tax=Capsulimonas sp. TaxID=2494211 RepID=UPI00326631F1